MGAPDTRSQVTEVWQEYWRSHSESLDEPSPQFIADALIRETDPAPGRRILEAGSGTGGLAQQLAQRGAAVTVLDIVPACIRAIRQRDPGLGSLHGAVGDLFHCPFPEGAFDVVFNSGVMEHFEKEEIRRGLLEMARVLRPGGTLVCLVPSSRGRFYVRGKRMQEKAGTWEFGAEYPQRSLRPYLADSGLTLLREYQTGVSYQRGFLRGWRWRVAKLLLSPFNEDSRLGAALFGGYLLVSCWRKPGGEVANPQ